LIGANSLSGEIKRQLCRASLTVTPEKSPFGTSAAPPEFAESSPVRAQPPFHRLHHPDPDLHNLVIRSEAPHSVVISTSRRSQSDRRSGEICCSPAKGSSPQKEKALREIGAPRGQETFATQITVHPPRCLRSAEGFCSPSSGGHCLRNAKGNGAPQCGSAEFNRRRSQSKSTVGCSPRLPSQDGFCSPPG